MLVAQVVMCVLALTERERQEGKGRIVLTGRLVEMRAATCQIALIDLLEPLRYISPGSTALDRNRQALDDPVQMGA